MDTHETVDVEMGPGMDLVISLLAFVVLILAILALERKVSAATVPPEVPPLELVDPIDPEALRGEISDLNGELARVRGEMSALHAEQEGTQNALNDARGALADAQGELAEARGRLAEQSATNGALETEIGQAREEIDDLKGQIAAGTEGARERQAQIEAETAAEIERLGAQLNEALELLAAANLESEGVEARLAGENEELLGKLFEERARAEIAEEQAGAAAINEEKLKDQLGLVEDEKKELLAVAGQLQKLLDAANEALREKERRIEVELSDSSDLRIFEQGKATLTPAGREALYGRLVPSLFLAVTNGKPNVLRVAGHASPERMGRGLRAGVDNNLQLSAERSLTIAYELASLGVPMRCIAVEGHGRARSPTLGKYLRSDVDLDRFDEAFARFTTEQKSDLAQQFPAERRVEVLVTTEKEGQCSSRLLSEGLLGANTEARRRLSNP